jgi:hypothetical protein
MSESILKEITAVGPKPIVVDGTVVNHWFWKFVPVDPLVFSVPVHDGSIVQIARQVYHRMLGRMVAENAHGMQAGVISVAWLVTIFMGEKLAFRGGGRFGILLGFAAFGAFLFFAVPILMRLACPSSASDEAQSIVKRAFLRELPPNTPADLRDELQNGWLTIDGRPLSSEISAEDGRTTEATKRSVWWIVTAFAVGWAVSYLFTTAVPAAAGPGPDFDPSTGGFGGAPGVSASPFGFATDLLGFTKYGGSWMVLLILLIKLMRDRRPLMNRAMELAAAEGVEGSAFVAAGGQAWGAIPETARKRQILEATRDKSATVDIGEATGVFAGRGDVFAPSAGLPFRLSLRDLQMHALVFGGTGSGKTSGILRPLARQLSEHEEIGLVIMDGKGALPSELADLPGMKLVDPARGGVEISLVSGVEPSVIIDTVREILAPAGAGQDMFWVNSAAGALRRGAVIAQAAGGAWWSLYHSAQVVSNKQDRDQLIEALIPKAEEDPLLREAFTYFRFEWDPMEEKTRSNILAVIRSWLSTITATPELLRWAKTPAGKDSIDILAPLTGGRIGLLIPEYRYGVAGSVVTALIKARLYSGLKSRADRDWGGTMETPVAFIVDEAQEVATSQDAQMLPIGRSLGLAMIAATQGIEGINAKLGEATALKWLSIFGSVIALSGRSPATDELISQRAGQAWQLTPSDVEGNTVRGSLAMEAMSGPVAVSRTQPHMAQMFAKGSWFSAPGRLAQAMAVVRGGGPVPMKDQSPIRMMLGPRPLVVGGEIASIAAVPDTAVVLATRGRVPRRDVVRLHPEYPGSNGESARALEQAQAGMTEARIGTAAKAVTARV